MRRVAPATVEESEGGEEGGGVKEGLLRETIEGEETWGEGVTCDVTVTPCDGCDVSRDALRSRHRAVRSAPADRVGCSDFSIRSSALSSCSPARPATINSRTIAAVIIPETSG